MTSNLDSLKNLEDVLCIFFKGKRPTHSQIVEKAHEFWDKFVPIYNDDDFEQVIEYVEYNVPISSFEADFLVNEETESHWLTEDLQNSNEEFAFRRYKRFLREQNFSEAAIDSIEADSRKILGFSANPKAESCDKKRGLAVGDVQSGKTANYTALVNLACDYGYKIIVILAGLTDSLREQTQMRIDNGLIGAISETIGGQITYVGVGIESKDYFAVPLTNTKLDFLKFIKESHNSTPEAYSKPLILVVKKNGKVLRQVQEWLKPGKNRIHSHNILIIDDEADNASVNTKRDEDDPTIINKYIRQLYNNFNIATYIGYTATPFANIFITPDSDLKMETLFPSDFIVQLKTPSNYFGAKKVFSTREHIHILDEHEPDFLPVIHNRYKNFRNVPDSMKDAICAFLLGCAVRTLRRQNTKHRSMLINISRFNDVQDEIRVRVSEYVEYLSNVIIQDSYKETSAFIANPEANRLYKVYNTESFFKNASQMYSFNDVKQQLIPEAKLLQVVVINNSNTKSRFKYQDYEEQGARVIVIGGFVLSRGLTLEGLMVSYYSRNASAYDTLLQMCRWFGYRPGYEDICALYISQINIDNFGAVIDAVDDLKEQFATMALKKKKPENFGLMVKESPNSLATAILVTSRNKMYNTQVLEYWISYGGELVDTSKIYSSRDINQKNSYLSQKFVIDLHNNGYELAPVKNRHMIVDVPKKYIANFLQKIQVHPKNTKFNIQCLADYIQQSQLFPLWDIVVATGDSAKKWTLANFEFNIPLRTSEHRDEEDFIRVAGQRNRLIDPNILNSGLSDKQMSDLIVHCGGHQPRTVTDYLSLQNRKPLFVIYPIDLQENGRSIDECIYMGFALAFPNKGKSEKTLCRANKVKYLETTMPLDDKDEDEELDND